jgi:hypothetical protein
MKINFAILLPLILSACASTSTTPQKASAVLPKNEPSVSNEKFKYDPQGKEEFVFDKVHPQLQRYAYGDLCLKMPEVGKSVFCYRDRLPYEIYVGKKLYYTDKAPVIDGDSIIREAVIETGDVVYLISSTKYKHVGEKIIPLALHNKITNFKPVPLVPGSKVMITGYSAISKEEFMVSSQDESSFSQLEIDAIRKIASQNGKHGPIIADLLSTLRVEYDDFEKRTIITHFPFKNEGSFLSLKLVIGDNGQYIPYSVVHYKSDDWLFVKSYSISADGYRWDSPVTSFQRDHSDGKIWEWDTAVLTQPVLNMLEKMGKAKSAKIRYQGNQYYADYELTPAQKKELTALVDVAKLLSK